MPDTQSSATRNRWPSEEELARIERNERLRLEEAARQARQRLRWRSAEEIPLYELLAERLQHGDTIEPEETMQAGVKRHRVRTQTMLDRYLEQKVIEQIQHDAGMRLYRDFRASGQAPAVTGRYDVRVTGVTSRFTEHQLEAQQQLTAALRAVGPLGGILVHVCLCDLPAREWARAEGEEDRIGAAFLRKGLTALVQYYQRQHRRAS